MYEQVAQMRILLANINATMQALFHENEQLRKELENQRTREIGSRK